jgi:isocitrate dehydrogenase kinase/phosphatase
MAAIVRAKIDHALQLVRESSEEQAQEEAQAELLDAAFWQGHKERILAGHVHDVVPYEPSKRFSSRPAQ